MDNLRAQFGSVDYDDGDHAAFEDEPVREPPPSPIGQDERRMQVRAYNHWASLLADRNFPSIEDLDPASLSDFGGNSVLLDFTAGIDDPGIRYLGSEIAAECDVDQDISRLSDVPNRSLLTRITDHYMQILANQAPIGFEAEFVNQRGSTILYRGILLPYSSDDDTIDFIYGVINWKQMADQATSDELLLEIDNALEASSDHRRSPDPVTDWADGPGMDARPGAPVSPLAEKPAADDRFPQPAFGGYASEDGDDEEDDGEEAGLYEAIEAVDEEPEGHSRFASLLTLGGGSPARADFDEDDDHADGEDGGDPVARWLNRPTPLRDADDTFAANDGFGADDGYGDDAECAEDSEEPFELVDEAIDGEPEQVMQPVAHLPEPQPQFAELDSVADFGASIAPVADGAAADGLHDCLAAARELAHAARSSEDRSRSALYAAVSRAYDVSLAAAAEPQEFAELIADSGLTVQERAPMTPVVKLVFGADYDKTRIAEYATVLTFAHRAAIGRGALASYLAGHEGGLKGVVQAEREQRKAGIEAPARETPREALARKLRAIAPLGFEDIPADGEEFALVMIRRTGGQVVVLGEVADVPLVEKAAKKLVA